MKLIKKVLSGLTLLAAFGGAAHASTINVGGVTWNPDAISIADSDFTARYEFTEFFTTAANAAGDNDPLKLPDFNLAINPATVGLGDVLQGVGEIFKFNGVNYGDTGSTTGGGFCASCELTFVFGGFAINGPASFTNGWLNIYVDDTPDFNANTSADKAADGVLFLALKSSATLFQSNLGFQSGSFTGYFDVVGGIAANNFDTNTKQFAADLLQSASAQFTNPPPYQFLATSTGQIAGNTIPEPSTVFLMSLAMLGFAFARGKSKAK